MKYQIELPERLPRGLVAPLEACGNSWSRVEVYSNWIYCGASNLHKVLSALHDYHIPYFEPERANTIKLPPTVWQLQGKITLPPARVLKLMEQAVEDGRNYVMRRARIYRNRVWKAYDRGRDIDDNLAWLAIFIGDPMPRTIPFPKGVRGPSAHVIYQEHFATGVTSAHRELLELQHQLGLELEQARLSSREAQG